MLNFFLKLKTLLKKKILECIQNDLLIWPIMGVSRPRTKWEEVEWARVCLVWDLRLAS